MLDDEDPSENYQILYIIGNEKYPIQFEDKQTKTVYNITERISEGFYKITIFEDHLSLDFIGSYSYDN